MDIHIHYLGGNCPVQAEGTIDGKEFYFRARGEQWAMHIGGADLMLKPEWYYEEDYGTEPFAAGWMKPSEAAEFIDKAFKLYAEARRRPSAREWQEDPELDPQRK